MAAYVQVVDEVSAKTEDEHLLITTEAVPEHGLHSDGSSTASSVAHGSDDKSDTSLEDEQKPSGGLHDLYPISTLRLPDHHIDDIRSLRVVVIGAGIAGITAGILLPAKVPKIQLTILEKNEEVVSTHCTALIIRS